MSLQEDERATGLDLHGGGRALSNGEVIEKGDDVVQTDVVAGVWWHESNKLLA